MKYQQPQVVRISGRSETPDRDQDFRKEVQRVMTYQKCGGGRRVIRKKIKSD